MNGIQTKMWKTDTSMFQFLTFEPAPDGIPIKIWPTAQPVRSRNELGELVWAHSNAETVI